MTREEFSTRVRDSVLLFDGAMGTMLYSKGVYINKCYDEINLSKPEVVKEIHSEYADAGVDVLETNTFGANSYKLTGHGFGDRVREINLKGAQIARSVAKSDLLVSGSVGPLGVRIAPYGHVSEREARAAFEQQISALLEGGVDLLTLETFSDMRALAAAIESARRLTDMPVIASFTIDDDGNTLYGTSAVNAARYLSSLDVDAVGINCSVGPPPMMDALEEMVKQSPVPISIMPNAGTPREVEGRNFYLASREYMASYARRFVRQGARIVGGCCGTTPEYSKAMRDYVASVSPRSARSVITSTEVTGAAVEPISFEAKSNLASSLANGKFVHTVELVPPRGRDASKILKSCQILKDNGIDAVNIPDGPRALSRMSAQLLSVIIQEKIGIEAFLHYTCRDRNLLGMMSDMLGLSAAGIHNLLIVTGDPPKMGDYPDATAVFDVDAIGLTHLVSGLNHGLDIGGNPIGAPTGYLMGVGVNPGAIDREHEMDRLRAKVDAGAEVAVTQPVFDPEILLRFLDEASKLNVMIIAGIWPLVSLRNAEFMNNEVPGASVPDDIMARIREADAGNDALQEGIAIAREAVGTIRDSVRGIHVSAPFGNVNYALQVIQ